MPGRTSSGHRPANVPEHKKLYWMLWGCGMAILAISLLIALQTWSATLYSNSGITFDAGPTIILLAAAYFAVSLREVPADEIAGAYFYGKALVRLVSGLHFVPLGLMQVLKETRIVQEFQCPDEPEKVFKGDDKDQLPSGMSRPIRAVTRAPKDGENDLLDTRMTLIVNFVVQYAIIDIFDYVANFGSKGAVEKQLRDIGEVKIVEDITQNTPASFIAELPKINTDLATEVENRFENSGIKIVSVRLISPDITHDVSAALAGIPKARAEAKQVEVRAEGEKTKRTKEGEGSAAAELSLLTARADGQKKIKEALSVSGETIIADGAVRALSGNTDVLVVGAEGGMRDVMGLVKGAQSALSATTAKGA